MSGLCACRTYKRRRHVCETNEPPRGTAPLGTRLVFPVVQNATNVRNACVGNALRPRSVTRPLSKAKPAQPRRRSPTRLLALTPQDSLAGTDCGVSALNRSQKLDTRIRN